MAAKMGTFSTGTGTSDIAVTGVGFTPKAIFFWTYYSFGVCVSTSNRWAIGQDPNAGETAALGSNNCCVVTTSSGGIDGKLDLKSYDTDGFTLAVDDAFSSSIAVGYLALSGGQWDAGVLTEPGSTGNQSVSSMSFKPSTVVFASVGLTSHDSGSGTSSFSIGAAKSSSSRFCMCQYSTPSGADCGTCDNYSQGRELYHNGYCIATTYGSWNSAPLSYADFVSMNNDGFTINWIARNRSNLHYWVATDHPTSLGSVQTRTDGNDITLSGILKPAGLLMFGGGTAYQWSWIQTSLCWGGGDSASNRYIVGLALSDGFSTGGGGGPYQYGYTNSAEIYEERQAFGGTLVSYMDIKSIDPTGYTFVMDDVDTSAKDATYLTFASQMPGNQVVWF